MALGPVSLAFLAERTGAELHGDGDTKIQRVATLKAAVEGEIAFLANPRYRGDVPSSLASALILGKRDFALDARPRLLHDNPYACFARVAQLLDPHPAQPTGIHPTAHVARTARLGKGVSIGAHAVVGDDAEIGAGSILYPHAAVLARVRIGSRAVIHAQAAIGNDGFGFANEAGNWIKIPQTGTVLIGDDVEIGAGTTIDRGALGDTVIGNGVKLDNQIQVGHNVNIGAHTAMAGCVGIAGSATIGQYCTVGGGAVILGHLTIADRVNISAGALVTKSITQAGTYGGAWPLAPQREWLRSAAHVRQLDAMAARLAELEARLATLEKNQ